MSSQASSEHGMMKFLPFPACPARENHYVRSPVGLWRSLVARPSGGRKVAGSSPASPTKFKTARPSFGRVFLYPHRGDVGGRR